MSGRRIFIYWTLGVGLFSMLRPAPASSADAPAALVRNDRLRVLVFVEDDRPQFFSTRAAGAPGFEREILEGFARAQNLTFEVVTVARWDALIPSLKEMKGDVIAGHFTDIPARRAQIDFTTGVLPTRTVVVTRKPHRVVLTLAELKEERIGVVSGSAARAAAIDSGVSPTRLVEFATPDDVLPHLRMGKITAHVRSLPEAVLAQREDPDIQLGMFLGPASQFAFGVRKEDAALRRSLDAHIEMMRTAREWNRLVVKYFGDAALDILRKAQ
jgi:lysine/arginine/ornithine transport system substrate-binding protein